MGVRVVKMGIIFCIILVKYLTVWLVKMGNVWNVILIIYSEAMVSVYRKISFVRKWINMVHASSVWILTTIPKNIKNV